MDFLVSGCLLPEPFLPPLRFGLGFSKSASARCFGPMALGEVAVEAVEGVGVAGASWPRSLRRVFSAPERISAVAP